jgi:hypothetical protein
MQTALIQLDGATIDVDGAYGPNIAAAVLAYKQKRDIAHCPLHSPFLEKNLPVTNQETHTRVQALPLSQGGSEVFSKGLFMPKPSRS